MAEAAEQLLTIDPGVYTGISNDDYHSGPGLSSSAVKQILKSPLHYKHQYVDGNKSVPSAAMLNGTLVHSLVLEPDQALQDHVVVEASTRNTKLYKEAVAANQGRTVYLEHEFRKAKRIADAVLSHDRAAKLLDGSRNENSIYWDQGGVLAKCRPDIWRPDIRAAADLKTAADASPSGFQRQCVNLGYHVSAAWYMAGINTLTEFPPIKNWAWIVAENEAPYAVQVYAADPALIEKGQQEFLHAVEVLKQCLASGKWPAYSEEILSIELPAWAA